jgi:UDP-N-acetylglucosamine acyltransferase
MIHRSAIISRKARLGKNVSVGPYAIIEAGAIIGENTRLEGAVQILNSTTIGKNCRIFQGAIIGQIPQDLKYRGEDTGVVIGDNNVIREYVTVNLATKARGVTRIGDNNLIMAYSHVAHDCVIGNENILANNATLAGFVEISRKVVIGGLAAVHQYCRVGEFSIIGGCSKVVQDIPPFSMCDGHPAEVKGINLTGLKRARFSHNEIRGLKKAFAIVFFQGHPFSTARERLVREKLVQLPSVKKLVDFLSSSKRGIAR